MLEVDVDEHDYTEIKDEERPMFLHLTCSVHYEEHEDNVLRPISVSSLPTCLGQYLKQLYWKDMSCCHVYCG